LIESSSITTPDVSKLSFVGSVIFNHSSTVTITNFINAKNGQELNVLNAGSGQITVDGTTAYLASSVDWVGDDRATLKLMYWNGYWYEICRSTSNS
jgi:hypothetical protein